MPKNKRRKVIKEEGMNLFNINSRKNDPYEEENYEFKNVQPMVEPVSQPKPEPAPAASTGALKMKMIRPSGLGEATEIADSLKAGQTVVLNLDDVDDETAKRMIDYIAGVIYAINGKIERPSDRTFLLTPDGVSVDSSSL